MRVLFVQQDHLSAFLALGESVITSAHIGSPYEQDQAATGTGRGSRGRR